MSRPPLAPLLTPLGAARAAIGAPAPVDLPAFPEDLASIARASDLGEERLHLAWELARLVPGLSADEHRGVLVLALVMHDAIAQGSTRLPIAQLRDRAVAIGLSPADVRRAQGCAAAIEGAIGARTADARGQLALGFDAEVVRAPFAAIAGAPGEHRPWILEDRAIAPQRLVALEERLARRLAARSPAVPDQRAIDLAIDAVRTDPPIGPRGALVLTDEQTSAVRAAMRGPIAVVSGGPGTGKTSIVVSMLRALARAEPDASIALAAPTGKAADRMAQSIARALDGCRDPIDVALRERLPEARTLHRLLGWSPSEERFRHHEGSPLAERVVIVDEASMIDLAMMEQLVAALRPEARLVLLGDADQLPSVDPGAVLADLVGSGGAEAIAIARLTHSHRMDATDPAGAHVLGIARTVNDGVPAPIVDGVLVPGSIARASSLDLPGVSIAEPHATSTGAAREKLLAWWWEHRARPEAHVLERRFDPDLDRDALRAIFDRLESARLLCVTRGRPTGADAINAWMGARAARERRQAFRPMLLVGEPVIVVQNDYDRGLFNGDQGLVLWTGASAPSLVVRRGIDQFVAHRLDSIVSGGPGRAIVERAYAVTVHKAQGSEHDAVALVLPEEDVPRLLTREILYTAMTRARRSVLLVGSAALVERAVTRPAARATGLARRLRG